MNNVECTKLTDKLNLIIYYPRKTVNNLVSRNNNSPKLPTLKQTNIIYEYSCCIWDCELQKCSYIGMTSTLSRHLTMYLASGGPKSHTTNIHKTALTREQLVNNTKIIHRQQGFNRLQIMEALTIQQQRPLINNQVTGSHRTLQLYWNNSKFKTLTSWIQNFSPDCHFTLSCRMHTPTVPK